jgi:hypothetical protein
MQSIITKYLPATNFKGSRIKASCERGTIIIPYNCGRSEEGSHCAAAQSLVNRFIEEDTAQYGTDPAKNPWVGRTRAVGQIPSGSYVHVFIR